MFLYADGNDLAEKTNSSEIQSYLLMQGYSEQQVVIVQNFPSLFTDKDYKATSLLCFSNIPWY